MELLLVCAVYLVRQRADGSGEVLLGHKTSGRIVGVGGKVEPGETVRDAAVREVFEETGIAIRASDLAPMGVLDCVFPAHPALSQRSHVFTCTVWEGEPTTSEEIDPHWYPIDEVPYARMWDDTTRWLPGVLRGQVAADTVFTFGDDLATVVSVTPRAAG